MSWKKTGERGVAPPGELTEDIAVSRGDEVRRRGWRVTDWFRIGSGMCEK